MIKLSPLRKVPAGRVVARAKSDRLLSIAKPTVEATMRTSGNINHIPCEAELRFRRERLWGG